MKKRDVIIIGGGAAGVSAAINIKKINNNLKVTILEQNEKILKKVLKTGNGKCNLGNIHIDSSHYHNYDFFEKWVPLFDIEKYFKDLGLLTKTDSVGRIYPYSEVSNSVVDALRWELERLEVEVVTSFSVEKIKKDDNFIIFGKENYQAEFLVIATGSKAQSETNGYSLIKSLGHSITTLYPALTPIKIEENIKSLQGIKTKCLAKIKGKDFSRKGEILFKEDGISGILSLEMSRYVNKGDIISLDLVNDLNNDELKDFFLKQKNKQLKEVINGILPKMLGQIILNKSQDIATIIDNIKNFKLTVKELYGFNFAQITSGGVCVDEMSDSFESKILDKLYIIGEVLDVDGDCGGYNLYFAWLSGMVSGKDIASKF